MKVYFKKLHQLAKIPTQATVYAGGWDVTATEINLVGDSYVVSLGFALQLPAGYRLMIQPRSSISKSSYVMQNSPGLGDPDFFGEYKMVFRNLGEKLKQFPYVVGDRVGQCYLEKIIPIEFEIVEELNRIGDRNDAGYGSTGVL